MTLPARLCLLFAFTVLFSRSLVPAHVPEEASGVMPFGIGEELIYKVEWNPPWYLFFLPSMAAGTADLKMTGGATYQGKDALKIEFSAKSSGTLVKLAGVKVDDSFEFIIDPETLRTFAVAKRVREGKRKRNIEVVYFPKSSRLHILELNMAAVPPRVDKDKFVEEVPFGVQDVFSALYSMRLEKLELDASHKSIVGDNDRVGEVATRVEKRETVKTHLGKYDTWRLNTVALLGGLFQGRGKFRIWLSADDRKMPVKFEAKVKLGKVTGKLTAFTPGTRPHFSPQSGAKR